MAASLFRKGAGPLRMLARRFHGSPVTTILNPITPPPETSAEAGSGDASLAVSEETQHLIQQYATRPSQRLRVGSMLEWSKNAPRDQAIAQSAMFLHGELPVRIAERIECLARLPEGLNLMPSVKIVRRWYVESFSEVVEAGMPTDPARVEAFTKVLRSVWGRHGLTTVNVAKGVRELEKQHQRSAISGVDMHNIAVSLDQFHLGRIGIRLLVGHHLLLANPKRPGFVGMLKEDVNLRNVAERAASDATEICMRTYGQAPAVDVLETGSDPFIHVPDHIYYILLELLKNSMRATTEFHGEVPGSKLPPVRIVIANSPDTEDAAIKISDQGGGISRANMAKIWSHGFSTSEMAEDADLPASGNPVQMPIAGLGLGLPSARCYARYFGGDLNVVSLEGHGTDVYVHLDKSGEQIEADSAPKDTVQIAVEALHNPGG